MENLKIPIYYRTRGLYIYCNQCKRIITNRDGKRVPKSSCSHPPEKQVFKAIIYPPGSETAKTKTFNTRDILEARVQLVEFEKRIKLGETQVQSVKKEIDPNLYKQCVGRYLQYLTDKYKTKDNLNHFNQVKRYMTNFSAYLIHNKINTEEITIQDIDRRMVDNFISYLKQEHLYLALTVNRHLNILRGFYKYLIDIEAMNLQNPFLNITTIPSFYTSKAFPMVHFSKFINTICPENGVCTYSTGERKNLYAPYLKDYFKLAAYTGLRREGLVKLKFSDVKPDENGRPYYIITEDFKYNKRHNLTNDKEKKKIQIPIPLELEELLYYLGYKEKANFEDFLIEHPRQSRKTIMNNASKAFTHYWKQCPGQEEFLFKSLRKSYITKMHMRYGHIAHLVTHGANGDVISKHYLDVKEILDDMSGKKLYDKR